MSDTQTMLCIGGSVLAVIVIVIILLSRRPFSYSKRIEGTNTSLTIKAKRNLEKVTVVARFGNEEVNFERKRIKKGQRIDFVYPSSKKSAKVIVEEESGNVQASEV